MRIERPKFDTLETAKVLKFQGFDEEAIVFQIAPPFGALARSRIRAIPPPKRVSHYH
jgi:hypothetical protein